MYRLNSPFGPSTIRTEKKKEVRATRRGNAAAAAVALEVLLVVAEMSMSLSITDQCNIYSGRSVVPS